MSAFRPAALIFNGFALLAGSGMAALPGDGGTLVAGRTALEGKREGGR